MTRLSSHSDSYEAGFAGKGIGQFTVQLDLCSNLIFGEPFRLKSQDFSSQKGWLNMRGFTKRLHIEQALTSWHD